MDTIEQLREAAHELHRLVRSGDPDALARVRASHSYYTVHPDALKSFERFPLGDAQLTIAIEQGADAWAALIDAHDTRPRAKYSYGVPSGRALRHAIRREDGSILDLHLLRSLLDPPEATIVSNVLAAAGLAIEQVEHQLDVAFGKHRETERPANDAERKSRSTTTSPRVLSLEAYARGLALAQGVEHATDIHLLLALIYEDIDMFASLNLDATELFEALVDRGATVPSLAPPHAREAQHWGPRAYVVNGDDSQRVNRSLRDAHAPGTRFQWGMNHSQWKPGWVWFAGDWRIDIEAIARDAVHDQASLEIVPHEVAMKNERDANSSSVK